MSSFLFPITSEPIQVRSKKDFAPFLSDLARAASDSIDALCLFVSLVEAEAHLETTKDPSSPGFMAYDAHGGEAGCQLRAGMVLETYTIYRFLYLKMPSIWQTVRLYLDGTISNLQALREKVVDACMRVAKLQINPKKFGFGSKDDPMVVLGWIPLTDVPLVDEMVSEMLAELSLDQRKREYAILEEECLHLYDHLRLLDEEMAALKKQLEGLSTSTSENSSGPASANGSSAMEGGRASTTASSVHASEACPTASEKSAIADNMEASKNEEEKKQKGATNTATTTSRIEFFLSLPAPLATKWQPLNGHNLVRMLVFCYALSKYKSFAIINGTIGARLAPEKAAEVSLGYLKPYMPLDKQKAAGKGPGRSLRVLRELRELQRWLSDLTCAWQVSLARRSRVDVDVERLAMSTVQQSDLFLRAIACYPGFLLARESWAASNAKAIIVDRHFCPSGGFHYNIFTATVTLDSTNACPCHLHPLGIHVTWTLKPSSLAALTSDSDQVMPYLLIMGNSIAGGRAEYINRLRAAVKPHVTFAKECCAENAKHIDILQHANLDRLNLAFFASHKAYAFALEGTADQAAEDFDFVEQKMETWAADVAEPVADTLRESWRASRGEADAMGTGQGVGGMHAFTVQHYLLETKGRVARRIERWMELGELMPLHADV